MPSNMKRWNGTTWVTVSNFDAETNHTRWTRTVSHPTLDDLNVPGLNMNADTKDIHFRDVGSVTTPRYLDTSVGSIRSWDVPGYTLDNTPTGDYVITAKVRKTGSWTGSEGTIAAHGALPYGLSWAFHLTTAGNFAFSWSNNGSTFYSSGLVLPLASTFFTLDTDFYVGLTFTRSLTNQVSVQLITSANGVSWTAAGSPVVTASPSDFYNTWDKLFIGSRLQHPWGGRIYWAEMRQGTVPGSGTQLWRFDAEEAPPHSQSNFAWVDPRGQEWFLDTPGAINHALALQGNWSDWNSAWGIVARGTFYSLPGTINPLHPALANYNDYASVTFTPIAGRRYKFDLNIRAIGSQNGTDPLAGNFQFRRDGVVILGTGHDVWQRGRGQWHTWRMAWVATYAKLGTTSAMFHVQYNCQGSATQSWVNAPSFWIVRDLGPNRGDVE